VTLETIRPKRRWLRFESLEEAGAEAQRLLESGYERAGNWDLGQVCHHLARALDLSRTGFQFAWPSRMKILGPFILPIVLKTRWIPTGVKLPKGAEPVSGLDQTKEVEDLVRALREFHDHPGKCAVHPFFGEMSAQQWKRYHLVHCEHHLRFLIPK